MLHRAGLTVVPASGADIEFCFGLHRCAFYQYVTEIWGWDEDDQRAIHARNFKPERVQIVSVDGVWTSAGSTSTSATRRSSFCSSSYRRPTTAAASVAG